MNMDLKLYIEKIEEVENAINSNNNITSFVLAKKKSKNKGGNQWKKKIIKE